MSELGEEISQVQNRESILTAEIAPEHDIDFDSIANGLKSLDRWVNWKWSKNGSKWTKVPVHHKGFNASSVDEDTWTTFENAKQAVADHGYGIGFVFNNDGLVGIDIDDCRNPRTGEIKPWAMYPIKTLDTYAEISPSGTGVKLFIRGELPEHFRKKHNRPDGVGGVEIFSSGRFFTVTGLHLGGTPQDVQDRPEELTRIYSDVSEWKQPKLPPSTYVPSYHPSGSGDRDTAILALTAISPDVGYEDWLTVLQACHDTDPALLPEVVSWSRGSDKFIPGEVERKWASFTGGKGVGIGSLCRLADESGRSWRPLSQLKLTQETPEDRLKGSIELAYMELGSGRKVEEVAPSLISVLSGLSKDTDETIKEAKDPGNIPASLIQVDGLLGQIIDFYERGAHRSQPELAIASALAMCGTLMGRKVEGHLNTRTNVYLVGLGPSGCGKDRARKGNISILEHAGLMEFMPCEDVASGAGLLDAVAAHPAMLLMIDEIHKTLAATKDAGRNPHMFEVIGILLKLFSSSSSTYLGKAMAGSKRDTRINQPCLSLYGTGIPEGVWKSLTVDQLSDGFLSRLLIIESSNGDPDPQRYPDDSPPSQELIDQVQWWGKYTPPNNEMNLLYSVPRKVQDGPGVTDLFADGEQHYRKQRDKEQPADGLWTRATEKARKLALIHQLSRDRDAEFIQADSAQWALDFVEHITRRTLFHANIWVSDTAVGSNKLSVLRSIREMGGRATLTRIARANRGLAGKQRSEILADLTAEGSIRLCNPDPANGRPALTYELVM